MKKRKNRKNVLRYFVFGIICISVISLLGLSVSKIWFNIYEKYKEKKNLHEKLAKLKGEEENLKIDVKKMQDPEYIGRYLREKYFYSKDNEYIIRIPK